MGEPERLEGDAAQPAAGKAPPRVSILDVLARHGPAPKVLLRDVPSEHGASPLVDASSAELRQMRGLRQGRGDYELLGEVARGGMGVILKGHDRDLGRDLAMKVLRQELAGRPEIVQRFVEEAQIGGQLQHPGIVPVYELGLLADERPYFTMKLVKGRTLAALLAERSPPDADRPRFLALFELVCQTMAYAHSRGVIHRDLKPANVMVGAFGEVQVLDWGLAKVLAQGGVADEKRSRAAASHASVIATIRHKSGSSGSDSLAGSVMGTPSYMPPEQARGEIEQLDERSDVFSLGAILCEILTGRPPYDGEEALSRAANAELGDATRRLDACGADAELAALAKRCLAPAPAARPRHAGLVAKEIAAWRESTEARVRAAQIAVAEARVKADDERRARRLTAALAGSIIALLLVGGGGFLAWRGQRDDRRAMTGAAVDAALAEATLARGQRRFADAAGAAEKAVALASSADAAPGLRERAERESAAVARERAEAERAAAEARENRELLAALREFGGVDVDGQSEWAALDTAILDTFDAFGFAIDELPAADAAKALAARGLAQEVAPTFDLWTHARRVLGRADDADHLLDVVVAADPDPVRNRMRQAIRVGDAGDLRRFARDQELRALPARSLVLLAVSFTRAGFLQVEPLRILRTARALHPDDYEVQVALGDLNDVPSGRCDPDEALECYAAALALAPRSPRLLARIGRLLAADLGQPGRGRELLDQAVRLAPQDATIRRERGWVSNDACRFEEAAADLREACRLRPDDPDLRSTLSWMLVSVGDFEGALAAARESLRITPRAAWGHVALQDTLRVMGDSAGFAAAVAEADRLKVGAWTTSIFRAMLQAARGEREAARLSLARGCEQVGNNWTWRSQVAIDLARFPDREATDLPRALELARSSVAAKPKRTHAHEALGAVLLAMGDARAAITALERAIELSEGGTPIQWLVMAAAQHAAGAAADARGWLAKSEQWIAANECRAPFVLELRDEVRARIGE